MKRGPVLASDARAHVERVIGCDPANDPAVEFWAAMRAGVNEPRILDELNARTDKAECVRRRCFGWVAPGTDECLPAPRGCLVETEIDAANAFLLERHPALAESLDAFAMLESLYGLGCLDARPVRLPAPWSERDGGRARAPEESGRAEKCAARRISRALDLLRG